MKRGQHSGMIWCIRLFALLAMFCAVPDSWSSTAFIPSDPELVLYRTRSTAPDPASDSWKTASRAWRGNRTGTAEIRNYAEACVVEYRRERDPRYLGYAEAAFSAWTNSEMDDISALLLRASVRQGLHRFDECWEDLSIALKLDPANGQAWLARSWVAQARGDYASARRDQWQVFRHCPALLSSATAAALASLTGKPAEGLALLEPQLVLTNSLSADALVWSMKVAAECAWRAGMTASAREWLEHAAAIQPGDIDLANAQADVLGSLGDPAGAIAVLGRVGSPDPVLLRKVILGQRLARPPAEWIRWKQDLDTRMAALERRGDRAHRREQALYALHVQRNPAQALQWAVQNWSVQKEPEDLDLLMEAGWAARDADTIKVALAWINQHSQKFPYRQAAIDRARALAP